MRDVNWYVGLVKELEWDFKARNDLFLRIDDMVRPTWSLPAAFTETVKNVMSIISSEPSDAINSGAIAFSASAPIISVSPFAPNIMEYDRAQTLEDTLGFHFGMANKRGAGSFLYDIALSSLMYNTVCVRVDDLTHIFPKSQGKWTNYQKRAFSAGRFIHKAVNPRNVYYAESDLGITVIAHVESFRVLDIIRYWDAYAGNNTPESKMVSAALDKLKQDIGYPSTADKLRDMYFMQTYCIDDEKLMVWGSLVGNVSANLSYPSLVSAPIYIFADQDNPYGFIPWSIRVAGSRLESKMEFRVNPILAPLYWSGSWDKLNLAKSLAFSEPIRRAQSPRLATFTDSGDAPEIDYENGGDINMRRGEDVKGLQPVTLDQGAIEIIANLEAAMNRVTGASVIGNATQVSTRTSFAVYSAMVKVALSRLDKQREIMGRSCEDVCRLDLEWATKTNVPLESYAQETKQFNSGAVIPLGAKMSITKKDYDLTNLGIEVEIRPVSPIDEMEQINMAIQMSTHLNMPSSKLLEKMGYKNVGLSYELWAREQREKGKLNADLARMMAQAQGEGQLAAQQEMQQMQQQQSQSPEGSLSPMGAGGGVANSAFGSMGGSQGFNPALGGNSPQMGAPSMTRETITGKPQGG